MNERTNDPCNRYNFRYTSPWSLADDGNRALTKVFGTRIVFQVNGEGAKFDLVTLTVRARVLSFCEDCPAPAANRCKMRMYPVLLRWYCDGTAAAAAAAAVQTQNTNPSLPSVPASASCRWRS